MIGIYVIQSFCNIICTQTLCSKKYNFVTYIDIMDICMDQCMIDVTNVHNINTGDEVIIFGEDIVTADDIAGSLGTINYEIVCMISRRIPRIYLCEGKVVSTVNYLTE